MKNQARRKVMFLKYGHGAKQKVLTRDEAIAGGLSSLVHYVEGEPFRIMRITLNAENYTISYFREEVLSND